MKDCKADTQQDMLIISKMINKGRKTIATPLAALACILKQRNMK